MKLLPSEHTLLSPNLQSSNSHLKCREPPYPDYHSRIIPDLQILIPILLEANMSNSFMQGPDEMLQLLLWIKIKLIICGRFKVYCWLRLWCSISCYAQPYLSRFIQKRKLRLYVFISESCMLIQKRSWLFTSRVMHAFQLNRTSDMSTQPCVLASVAQVLLELPQ